VSTKTFLLANIGIIVGWIVGSVIYLRAREKKRGHLQ
jgi:uncharacterized membrane protein YciS (DUF1049 family)